ncbi:hypothetical protein BD626DRAFT_472636 [Schizophyllum amplum]|uniref:Aminoglycoside phosphotransferase domain-containing protein n=1 Tax=Schizophyllum amplum TaxID=97359 RepID=A0A550CW42_9AGAR|nr:hypothetical protein BD626DRAFT_472636 [Auriculariopsis ampla]
MAKTDTQPQRIHLAVLGHPKSGKKSLVDALTKDVYYRARDNASFVFQFEALLQPSESVFMAVIVLDGTQYRLREDVSSLVQAAKVHSPTISCFVLTKMDLIPSGVCPQRLDCLGAKPILAGRYGVDCLSTSSRNHEGIDELRAYIGSIGFSRQLEDFWCACSRAFLDALAACFSLPAARANKDVNDELSAIQSDEDIDELCKSVMTRTWNERLQHLFGAKHPDSIPANQISPSLIVKWPSSSERASMECVLRNTSIPVPRVHRPHLERLVMDLIEGETLLECWAKATRFMQFRIACTLRCYVKQLRSLTSSRVGGLTNGRAHGMVFQDQSYGPFTSMTQLRRFCEVVVFQTWQTRVERTCTPGDALPPIPQSCSSWDTVFIHGDLNPSNIILDKHNTLWIVDWETAGFYPACIESHSMRLFNDLMHPDDFERFPQSWRSYRDFIAGPTLEEDDRFWDFMEESIYRMGGGDTMI